MSDYEEQIITISIDDGTALESLQNVQDALSLIKKITNDIENSFAKSFKAGISTLGELKTSIESVTEILGKAINRIDSLMAQMSKEQVEDMWMGGISSTINGLSLVADSIETVPKLGNLFENVDIGSMPVIQSIQGYIAAVKTAAPEMGILTAMFPKLSGGLAEMGTWFTNVGGTIKTAIGGISSAFNGMSLGWGTVIAAVIALIVLLITNWDSVKTAIITAWETIKSALSTAAEWINTTVIQPIIAFFEPVVEWFSQLFQGIWQLVLDAVNNIVSFIANCVQSVFEIWATIGTWFYQNVIQPVADFFIELWTTVSTWATDAWNGIVDVFVGVGNWFYQNVIQPVGKFFSGLWDGICNAATSAWDFLVGIWESIKEVFGKVWSWFQETILDPLVNGFKGMVNGVIGFINGLIGGIINGINWIIRAINKIQFTVPDWVPGLGGMTLGFNLKELTAPQIPYLAKGAVLPANRPFLAVVGDQRHGTNVEAPFATIQEAVGLVMNDHINAMMAGFRALLEEQQATRRTIEGIEIGDRVIGEAAQRYQRKMAVTYGAF